MYDDMHVSSVQEHYLITQDGGNNPLSWLKRAEKLVLTWNFILYFPGCATRSNNTQSLGVQLCQLN